MKKPKSPTKPTKPTKLIILSKQERIEYIFSLYRNGQTQEEIAKTMKVSQSAISYLIRRYNGLDQLIKEQENVLKGGVS